MDTLPTELVQIILEIAGIRSVHRAFSWSTNWREQMNYIYTTDWYQRMLKQNLGVTREDLQRYARKNDVVSLSCFDTLPPPICNLISVNLYRIKNLKTFPPGEYQADIRFEGFQIHSRPRIIVVQEENLTTLTIGDYYHNYEKSYPLLQGQKSSNTCTPKLKEIAEVFVRSNYYKKTSPQFNDSRYTLDITRTPLDPPITYDINGCTGASG